MVKISPTDFTNICEFFFIKVIQCIIFEYFQKYIGHKISPTLFFEILYCTTIIYEDYMYYIEKKEFTLTKIVKWIYNLKT